MKCTNLYQLSQLTPVLALLLVHDLLLSKKGITLPRSHGLSLAVSRHKARLSAELTKARIRRGLATLGDLRNHVNAGVSKDPTTGNGDAPVARHPRWIRVNTLRSSLETELTTTFSQYGRVSSLKDVMFALPGKNVIYVDEHIPNLVAILGTDEPTKFKAYLDGKLIFQEKASCFPAYLLDPSGHRHVIDACAAPGNKTSHLAAIMGGTSAEKKLKVTACEKDSERSKTLSKMIKIAGGDAIVNVKQKQDFLRLDPTSKEFSDVTALLLDPSCSGSGIVGRDEVKLEISLPSTTGQNDVPKGKKRKRGDAKEAMVAESQSTDEMIVEENPDQITDDKDLDKLKARLESLSTFQLRLLKHAMTFPAAERITYSTCSIHDEENEAVVVKALLSDVAVERGWMIMQRAEQVDGLKRWHKRGNLSAAHSAANGTTDSEHHLDLAAVADACIRCDKRGDDGTMGFFVAGFVRDPSAAVLTTFKSTLRDPASPKERGSDSERDDEEEEWEGFGDEN